MTYLVRFCLCSLVKMYLAKKVADGETALGKAERAAEGAKAKAEQASAAAG